MADADRRDPNPTSPNVVIILADDLGWGELGSYGQRLIRTPNIDKLAGEGMRFMQAYAGAPVCAPSRGVLLTGLHTGHATIRTNRRLSDADGNLIVGQHPLPDEDLTIAEVFQGAGYATAAIGKWGLGPAGSTGDPLTQGFEHFYGFLGQREAHSYYPPYLWDDGVQITINTRPIPAYAEQPEGEVLIDDWISDVYAPDLLLNRALQFIEEHERGTFFPLSATHPASLRYASTEIAG